MLTSHTLAPRGGIESLPGTRMSFLIVIGSTTLQQLISEEELSTDKFGWQLTTHFFS